ncbi:RNA polymerase sigma factor [Planctomycetota bacterium]
MSQGHTTTRMAGEALRETPGESLHHARLFERVMGRIYRYFRKLVHDQAEAEDLAQQTLLELERSLREQRYDPDRSFNTWMWLKAHTAYAQWCRRLGRRMEPLPADAGPELPDTSRAAGEALDAETVLTEVERQLGSETYECFVLYYQGGLTLTEVGEVIGRNRKTVADRIASAHRLIDRLL